MDGGGHGVRNGSRTVVCSENRFSLLLFMFRPVSTSVAENVAAVARMCLEGALRVGITSILRRFEVCASASFCCDSIQYSLYIARATDIISHSLFAHETSSYSIVLLGTDGEKSGDCVP